MASIDLPPPGVAGAGESGAGVEVGSCDIAGHRIPPHPPNKPSCLPQRGILSPVTVLPFTALVFAGSLLAGLLGSLTGLGGGGIIIPMLVVAFGVDLKYAIGASLIAVIATSSGAAAAYVKEGFTNIRIGMLLEVATTLGALLGAWIALGTPVSVLSIIFGIVLFWTAWSSMHPPPPRPVDTTPDPLATRLRLDGTFPTPAGLQPYGVHRVPWGFGLMFGAGILSALLGIGSGVVKVIAMDRVMRVPFKVSTTTSNFMIGVTAAASAGVYLHRGQIDPNLAAPVAFGALVGSFAGARILPRANVRWLRIMFAAIVALSGAQMIWKGVSGSL